MGHNGSCHCGAVRFTVASEITELTQCDCSLCVKRNAVMARAPEDALEVTSGREMLTLYRWNTRKARHYFCSVCGIYVFHKKRSAPEFFGINVFCLDGFDSASLPIRAAEGANMTIEDPALRSDLPGPRL
jgi:hypothetical protein